MILPTIPMFFYWRLRNSRMGSRSSDKEDGDECGDFCDVLADNTRRTNWEDLLKSAQQQLDDLKSNGDAQSECDECNNCCELRMSSHHTNGITHSRIVPFEDVDVQLEPTEESYDDDDCFGNELAEPFEVREVPWLSDSLPDLGRRPLTESSPYNHRKSQNTPMCRTSECAFLSSPIPRYVEILPSTAIEQEPLLPGDPTDRLKSTKKLQGTDEFEGIEEFGKLLRSYADTPSDKQFDETLAQLMNENPLLLQVQYLIEEARGYCFPMHFLAANSCIKELKEAYSYFPEAIGIVDYSGDTALHYACRAQAGLGIVTFLIHNYPTACKQTNDSHQTPLHSLLLSSEPGADVLSFLVDQYSTATQLADQDGNTPLHILLTHQPSLDAVQLLARRNIRPILSANNRNLDKVLHTACRHGASLSVVEWLLESFPYATRSTNEQFSLPLHICVQNRHWHLVKALVTCYPEAKGYGNSKDQRPYDLAVVNEAPEAVLELLSV